MLAFGSGAVLMDFRNWPKAENCCVATFSYTASISVSHSRSASNRRRCASLSGAPISLVVPFAAGGAGDTVARVVVERMRGPLGQPVVIENVTGADGTIGTARVARARPDGYTLCLGTNGTHVLNGAFYSLPYDVLNDFVPVSPLVIYPDVLYARGTITARDLNELVGWFKANKASAGITAGDFRLITMSFQRQISATLTLVPYRGGAPAVQDLGAGQIPHRCICRSCGQGA
jgi:tripartite-type tricarboxylate transporter receptor subunit TctC